VTLSNGFKPPDVDVRRLENLVPDAIQKPSTERGNPPVFFTRKPLSPSLINDGIGFGEQIKDRFLLLKVKNKTVSLDPHECTFLMTTSGKVTPPDPKEDENP
jgi:hypothetical protein